MNAIGLSAPPGRAPLLVIAVGNPSRGDDALGPTLLERLQALDPLPDVEWLTDFQLQVEHSLDLLERRAVLFVDAAHPGHGHAPVSLVAIGPDPGPPSTSHALRPQALLQVAQRVLRQTPAAWLLAIEGTQFTLGEGLSAVAQERLLEAEALARQWLAEQRAALASEAQPCT